MHSLRHAKFLSTAPGDRLRNPFSLFCLPIRRKCHRLIPDNVASGKLEREYIARGSASPLCDSDGVSHGTQLRTPRAVLSSGFAQWKIFPTQRSKFSHWMPRDYVLTVNAPFTSKLHPSHIPIYVYGMPFYEFSCFPAKTNSTARMQNVMITGLW